MGKKGGPNAKQMAGRALKAENEAKKQAETDRLREASEAKSWQVGSNTRQAGRDESAAKKAEEQARKAREKAELLAQEEAEMGKGGKAKTPSKLSKKGKNKKLSDLDLLEASLQTDAAKKLKKKKEEALKKKQQEEAAKKAKEEAAAAAPVDPLLANTAEMIGTGDSAGRLANQARMAEDGASGLDAALVNLNVGKGMEPKSNKALYAEFEARKLPEVKRDHPGLRLSQYKEKIYQMWKKSPENPINQIQPAGA